MEDYTYNESPKEEEEKKEDCPDCRDYKKDKKIKNLISIAILLGGLFLGSLFVDIAQIVKGSGYSAKNLSQSDIFETDGKTWVAYGDPAVGVEVISDEECEKCNPGEALVWFRRVLPTVAAQKIDYQSEEGKELISKFNIKTLPAFIFNQDIEDTEFYAQAGVLFELIDDKYVLDTKELGLPAGKYLETPPVSEQDAVFGNAQSNVKVVVYSDFQCPYCKVFFSSLRDVMKNYEDKVYFAYKDLPLTDIHPQAESAALAGKCALEQRKFWEYADKLFGAQSEWGITKDTTLLKTYARTLGLDANQFNQCLDSKKYQDAVETDRKEALDFGITGTPAVFVNDQFEAGAVDAEQFEGLIEGELQK